MSRLLIFDREALPEPEHASPAPERIISGDPRFQTWNLETSADEGTYSGFWQATPGAWRVIYDEWEYCEIIEGVSVLHEDNGPATRLEAGMRFVIRPGFTGVWEVIETTLKAYVIRL